MPNSEGESYYHSAVASAEVAQTSDILWNKLSRSINNHETQFNELLQQRSVVPVFQPLVRLCDNQTIGYELLGRGDYVGLPRSPLQLLDIASRFDKESELSELFREVGLQQAHSMGNGYTLFLNIAPNELALSRLAASLRVLRGQVPQLPLVLEIHEATLTTIPVLSNLRALLNELSIELAYDDFGVGRSRLLELIEVPPDWLKFDITLIQSLRQPSTRAWQVVETLVSMVQDLGIKTVAEGVETETEMQACKELGFDVAQGYLLGKPLPLFESF